MTKPDALLRWAIENWAKASLPIALLLLALGPLLSRALPASTFMVYLMLPTYMAHQYEEHSEGRFKMYFNTYLGQGRELLTATDMFWINILFVWGLSLVGLYLTASGWPVYGLAVVYFAVINGILHVAAAVIFRRYIPGLMTSLALFFPVGGYAAWVVSVQAQFGAPEQAVGVALALLAHVPILPFVVVVRRRSGSPGSDARPQT